MKKQGVAKFVERLFPFVLRSRNLMVGRETLGRNKSRLHFVLITLDISEQSRAEVLSEFAHYPVVQLYASAELEQFFGVKGTKVIGFQKSGLAQSIYAELKQYRLNKPGNRGTVLSGYKAETCQPGESLTDAPSKKSSPVL